MAPAILLCLLRGSAQFASYKVDNELRPPATAMESERVGHKSGIPRERTIFGGGLTFVLQGFPICPK